MAALTFRRGDVVLVPFPFVTDFSKAKTRPAVVIQNNIANRYSPNLILALISSTIPKKEYPFHYRVLTEADIARQAGLDKDSIVKAEIIITVPKSSIVKKIGSFPGEAMVHIDECLKISLAL